MDAGPGAYATGHEAPEPSVLALGLKQQLFDRGGSAVSLRIIAHTPDGWSLKQTNNKKKMGV